MVLLQLCWISTTDRPVPAPGPVPVPVPVPALPVPTDRPVSVQLYAVPMGNKNPSDSLKGSYCIILSLHNHGFLLLHVPILLPLLAVLAKHRYWSAKRRAARAGVGLCWARAHGPTGAFCGRWRCGDLARCGRVWWATRGAELAK